MLVRARLAAGLLVASLVRYTFAVGNTTCASNALDWYTDASGKHHVRMTYQRLRQICNSQYEVPSMPFALPGDLCNDQLGFCCCNSISYALSMLCFNCQWLANTTQDPHGWDADDPTTFYLYHWSNPGATGVYCGDGTNQTLPANIQSAVCNENIRLDDFLYTVFWNSGDCMYTKEYAQQQQATNKSQTFTHCPNNSETSSSVQITGTATHIRTRATTRTTSSSTTQTVPPGKSSDIDIGAVVGGTVGGVAAVAAVALSAALLMMRNRRHRCPKPILDLSDTDGDPQSTVSAYPLEAHTVTPFTIQSDGDRGDTHNEGAPPTNEKYALLRHDGLTAGTSITGSDLHKDTSSSSGTLGTRVATSGVSAAVKSGAVSGPLPSFTTMMEQDAGRLVIDETRLPPAYRPEWQAERLMV
ncbi:uncharacterized protein B0H18DRAFT_975070 [Fomitopsis serialis]|uniref:uncharacterized protein n=1 Tax=Fomitopsis serialis TaxID=139415 RepID=UPI0020079365|nr:uncharacterized protein B0H18DRAFT_975070 [Neoantrodia serialis]KAH9935276.1 hypothetical protein B0H18DRAFT_975070 [Neoantrodia serialis]